MPEKVFEAALLGRKGGAVKSERKTAAVRRNGRKGGLKGGPARSEQKAAAARENGKKGGRPRVHNLGAGYTLTDSRKLFSRKLRLNLSQEQFSVIKQALRQKDFRTALIKAKRFWTNLDHDPELDDHEEKSLSYPR